MNKCVTKRAASVAFSPKLEETDDFSKLMERVGGGANVCAAPMPREQSHPVSIHHQPERDRILLNQFDSAGLRYKREEEKEELALLAGEVLELYSEVFRRIHRPLK